MLGIIGPWGPQPTPVGSVGADQGPGRILGEPSPTQSWLQAASSHPSGLRLRVGAVAAGRADLVTFPYRRCHAGQRDCVRGQPGLHGQPDRSPHSGGAAGAGHPAGRTHPPPPGV